MLCIVAFAVILLLTNCDLIVSNHNDDGKYNKTLDSINLKIDSMKKKMDDHASIITSIFQNTSHQNGKILDLGKQLNIQNGELRNINKKLDTQNIVIEEYGRKLVDQSVKLSNFHERTNNERKKITNIVDNLRNLTLKLNILEANMVKLNDSMNLPITGLLAVHKTGFMSINKKLEKNQADVNTISEKMIKQSMEVKTLSDIITKQKYLIDNLVEEQKKSSVKFKYLIEMVDKKYTFYKRFEVDCPKNWSEFNNACYLFQACEKNCSWNYVRDLCFAKGADLASVHSKEENDFIVSLKSSVNHTHIIIGGRKTKQSVWIWSDRSAFNYTSWGIDEPQKYRSCMYVGISGSSRWYTPYSCAHLFDYRYSGFVCKSKFIKKNF